MTQENAIKVKQENPIKSLLFLAVLVAALAWFISNDPQRAWNILLVLLGFGAVIFVHELGHFVAAKSVGIKVEAFSIGIGPVLLGIKRVQGGFLVCFLPTVLPGPDGNGVLHIIIPYAKAKPGETEYRISLIPLGGFVAMLGQSDTGADEMSDDPRSFGNKAIWQRAIVIAAGVTMNIICGSVVFILVFMKGVPLPPAIVGEVVPDSPAAKAGLKPGDEIVAINGKENVDFMELMLAGAFAETNQAVKLKVRRRDNSIEEVSVVPEKSSRFGAPGMKGFGIQRANSLTIPKVDSEPFRRDLAEKGLKPGDTIIAVNGKPITQYYQLIDVIKAYPVLSRPQTAEITVRNEDESGKVTERTIPVAYVLAPAGNKDNYGKVLGMKPLMKIVAVQEDRPAALAGVKVNDIVLRIGTITSPNYKEFSTIIHEHNKQELELVVSRIEQGKRVRKTLQIIPTIKRPKGLKALLNKPKPTIGVILNPAAATELPIVCECVSFGKENTALTIPRGARLLAVNSAAIKDWYDLIRELVKYKGKSATLTYKTGPEQPETTLDVQVPDNEDWIGFKWLPYLGNDLFMFPLKPLKKIYKADGISGALKMGFHQTYGWIAQTYLTLRGMITGSISPESVSGPVGIIKMSYNIVDRQSYMYFFYFMAIINVCIAVFNFLPLPVLDGGIMVMLLIEKVKGSPVPVRVQGIVTYAGLFLIACLFLYVTYNDILKWVTGQI